MRKQLDAFLIETFVLIILVIFVSGFYLSQKMIALFFDADMLYLPVLLQDLLYQGGHYCDWNLTPVPYFFPDWLIFFIAFSLTKKIYFQFLIVACINVLMIYLALRLIYQEFFSKKKSILFSLTSISCFLFLSSSSEQFHDQLVVMLTQPYQAVYLPNIHVGSFTIGLFYIWIQLRLLAQKEVNVRSYFLFFSVFISLATGMSDLLYILQFTLPVFLAYLFLLKRQINWHTILLFALMPLMFSLLGGWLIKYIVHSSTLWGYLEHPTPDKLSFSVIKIVVSFFIVAFFKKVSLLVFIVFFIFYASVVYIFIGSILNKNIKNNFYVLDNKLVFFNCFILFSVAITILSTGLGRPAIRYIYPFFYFPILNFFYMGYFFKNTIKVSNYLSYFSVVVLSFFLFLLIKLYFLDSIKLYKDYYPDDIRCIDDALRTEGHQGVSDYWQAFPSSMLSREKLTVRPLQRDLKPFNFIANTKWFTNKYSFAIFDKNTPSLLKQVLLVPDENLIRKINGKPKKIVFCGNKKLLIYPKNKLRTSYFLLDSGDELTWLASELPSQFRNSKSFNTRVVNQGDGIGYVTFGPYIPLTAGQYRISIVYVSDAPSNSQVGYWDIVSSHQGVLAVKTLWGTNSEAKIITDTLLVSLDSQGEYQIRTYFSDNASLTIESLTLIKQ